MANTHNEAHHCNSFRVYSLVVPSSHLSSVFSSCEIETQYWCCTRSLCLLFPTTSSFQPLHFPCLEIWIFQVPHTRGITQHLSFCERLILQSMSRASMYIVLEFPSFLGLNCIPVYTHSDLANAFSCCKIFGSLLWGYCEQGSHVSGYKWQA